MLSSLKVLSNGTKGNKNRRFYYNSLYKLYWIKIDKTKIFVSDTMKYFGENE